MGSSGNSLFYNKRSKNDIYFNGFPFENTPRGIATGCIVYLKLSFPSIFCLSKTKNLRENAISIKQLEKHRPECMNAFLFIVKARQQHGPSLESTAIALSQDPNGFH